MEYIPVQEMGEMDEAISLESICRAYGTGMLRLATLYLKDPHLAEDAVQETLIKLYRSRDRFDPDRSEKAWVMRILVNTCKDMLRTPWIKRVRPVERVEDIPDPRSDPQALADRTVVEQIRRLPGKYRDVILLFYYQQLSTREIADALGVSEGAVRVRLTRGRTILREKLRDWWDYDGE